MGRSSKRVIKSASPESAKWVKWELLNAKVGAKLLELLEVRDRLRSVDSIEGMEWSQVRACLEAEIEEMEEEVRALNAQMEELVPELTPYVPPPAPPAPPVTYPGTEGSVRGVGIRLLRRVRGA